MLKEDVDEDELVMIKYLLQNTKLMVTMNKVKATIFETMLVHHNGYGPNGVLKSLFSNCQTCCLTTLGSTSVILVSSRSINFSLTDSKNIAEIFLSCSEVLH